MPFQAWILLGSGGLCLQCPVASMGPCPFRHGYNALHAVRMHFPRMLQWGHALSGMDTWRVRARSPTNSQLQWGHALSGMDTSVWRRNNTVYTLASMGPCPFRHGYLYGYTSSYADKFASMGPCPFRHGYLPQRQPTARLPGRFNGAMPFQAWIPYGTPPTIIKATLLQWGHALSGMDTFIRSVTSRSSGVLQWGHALSGMDTRL